MNPDPAFGLPGDGGVCYGAEGFNVYDEGTTVVVRAPTDPTDGYDFGIRLPKAATMPS